MKAKSIDRIVSAQAATGEHCTVKSPVKNAACNIVDFMHNGEFVETRSYSIPSSGKK
jgi:hypothetical protein